MACDAPSLLRVREALARLLGCLLDDADVGLIDLGADPGRGGPVLRVHVRDRAALSRLSLPAEVDGVPVRVIVADYQVGR